MKKKISVMIAVFALIGTVTGCQMINTETKNENSAQIELQTDKTEEESAEISNLSKGDLKAMFEEVNNEAVLKFFYDDYNKDGVHEAFALTENNLWYISPAGCEIVIEKLQNVDVPMSEILSFQTKDYLLLQFDKAVKNTLIYSIDNEDKLMEANISDKGIFTVGQDGTMRLVMQQGGAAEKKEQVTCYLYYQIDEGFREYGAIPISEEQFLEYEGADEILEKLYKEFEGKEVAFTFLYRSNHIIDINIAVSSQEDKANYNIEVKYGNVNVEAILKHPVNGKAETAYMLDIATFPTSFKHPMKYISE